jgi:hypothetical protein
MEVKLIRENPDGSADYAFDMSDKEKESLLCLGILTALKKGIEEGKQYMAEQGELSSGQNSSTL